MTTKPDAAGLHPGAANVLMGNSPLRLSYREIVLAHGSGGKLGQHLIEGVIVPEFRNTFLEPLHDGAVFSVGTERLAFSTDSYVVNPIVFPGGDIGKLAVYGTVNDLAMCGAKPLHLSVAFILEEGLPMDDFRHIVQSMRAAAEICGVTLVTGDTKVVDRGKADKIFINTSGIGVVPKERNVGPKRARPGDRILLSGTIATHGIAILAVREGLDFGTEIASDTAPLHSLVEAIFATGADVHVLRDPTRGGVTSALSEITQAAGTGMVIDEAHIPISEAVKGACEILGLDPLYVANEGKLIAIVPGESADAVLAAMQAHPLGRESAIIGEVTADHAGFMLLKTRIGTTRVVEMLAGEELPRIC